MVSEAPTTAPAAQNNDPCAGKKGKIDPNTGGGLKAGINHVSDRHIDPQGANYKGKKSVFEFGSIGTKGQPSLTKGQKEKIVLGILQEAFEKGAANRLSGGDYAYSYAVYRPFLAGAVRADFIGRDYGRGRAGEFTNVRTVILDITDCQNPLLINGFPGLNNPTNSVNGNPVWTSADVIIR